MRSVDFQADMDSQLHEDIVHRVKTLLDLNKQISGTRAPDVKKQILRQIDAMDRRIDKLVYELYGLTEEEIAVVEEATS